MALDYERLRIEKGDGIARVVFTAPASGNALDDAMRQELVQALLALQDDEESRVVTLEGEGDDFCVGLPRAEISALREGSGFEKVRPLLDEGRRIVGLVDEFAKPVIALLTGRTRAEGAALAMACDIRIAHPDATLSFDFAAEGMSPSWGTSGTLTRLAGPGTALELFWSGREIGAAEARDRGLVQLLAKDPGAAARELGQRLAGLDPALLHLTRLAVQSSHDCDLAASLDLETEIQHRCWGGPRRGAARN